MPLYKHTCKVCGYNEDFLYPMSECNDEPDNKWNNMHCPICEESLNEDLRDYPHEKGFKEFKEKLLNGIKLKRTIGNVGVMFFQSGDSNFKREVLKKRSHEHFEKHLKEKFNTMNKRDYIP